MTSRQLLCDVERTDLLQFFTKTLPYKRAFFELQKK